jgi:hypothetical protein
MVGVLVVAEVPGIGADDDAELAERLGLSNGAALGCRLRLAGPLEGGGRRIVTLWESLEHFEAWRDGRLAEVLHGKGSPVPTMHIWEIDAADGA